MSKKHVHADGRALWRCSSCGLLQTFPMPSPSELAEYYQRYDVLGEREPYYQAMWGKDALDTPEGRAVAERFAWAKRLCGSFGKVLDVGSGPGLFLRLAKTAGAEAVGVELNHAAAAKSAEEVGVRVVSGSIGQVEEKDFDVITLWDLLEHVSDPVALAASCRERLKSGGWIFIETPDESALLDRAVLALSALGIKGLSRVFYGLHHLVLFRPATVRKLLEANGFRVAEIRPAETEIGRIFRGRGLRDKMMRAALGALFLFARLIGRRNKMLIAARKV